MVTTPSKTKDEKKKVASSSPEESGRHLIKPRALKKGDTIAIVAPSSNPFEEGHIEYTYQWLTELGFKYKLGKHVFDVWGDMAGQDEARLADFHDMWRDESVAAIMPLRGGTGSVRLLPHLDFEMIKKNPKIFIGYSDTTGLLIPIHQKTGLVTFHGPLLGSFFESSYSYHYYQKALTKTKPMGLIGDPISKPPWKPDYPPTRMIIAPGEARGRLVGGCLTLIRQLMGTPYEIETEGRLVFIEDVQEEPHNVDRMISQLLLAGKLQKAKGIIVGECSGCVPGARRNVLPLNYSVERMLRERLGDLGIPVIYGMKIGHSKEKVTLPLGVMATLDASGTNVKLKLEESATVA